MRSIQDGLKRGLKGDTGVNWARPESIHLTLKFLGEIDPERVGGIAAELEGAGMSRPGFTVSAGGVGGFPNLKTPRVIWVGIEQSPELKGLHSDIDERLGNIGFEREERGFTPHLTLCRIKSMADSRALGRLASDIKAEKMLDFKADSFILFESRLGPKGAAHTAVRTFPLRGGTENAYQATEKP